MAMAAAAAVYRAARLRNGRVAEARTAQAEAVSPVHAQTGCLGGTVVPFVTIALGQRAETLTNKENQESPSVT